MTKHWLTPLGVIFLNLAAAQPPLAAARGLEFYVAVDGNDANPGTRTKPFASLEAARDAIRAAKSQRGLPQDGVTVWIRGGDYCRTRSFELTSADSGVAQSPVQYHSYRNERVRLIGGRALEGWQPAADPTILARLDERARAHVVQADLRGQGIADFGPLRSRGFGRPISPAHLELFYGGAPMTLARWPNEGEWERIAGFPPSSGKSDEHGGNIGDLPAGFLYSGDRPRRWQTFDQAWVHGYWAWDWANSYERIESIDPAQRLIKTAPPHGLYGFRKGQRFYFLNVLEELDRPGEWFLDSKNGLLYFWPPTTLESSISSSGKSARDSSRSDISTGGKGAEVLVSLLESPLISLTEASHVAVRGLTLEGTRGHGIQIRGGASNLIAGCAIRLTGNYGVWIENGHGHEVRSCDIEDNGDGGVHLSGGDRQTLAPSGHVVENCHFQRQGRWSKCYVPAVLASGVGHRIAHNLIHEHPHCAILFSGNEHRIEFNEIHHVALETGDVGAIYTGRDWTFRGNAIRHNFIHHTGGVGMGSMGVYMDDCVSGTEIYGNVFYKVQRATFLGGGRDHRVENNIFVECQPAVQIDGRGLDKSPVWHNMVYDNMRKQLAAVPRDMYRRQYPLISKVDSYYDTATNGIPPEGNRVIHNVSVGGKWLSVGWHAKSEMFELRDNYVGSDPEFVAAEKMDFRLKRNSPVWATGFKAIPFEKIGLQDDAYRRKGAIEARRR